jgi:seryl-tRNA synthetase
MPAAISFDTLERAGYFESFPHWLTAASHLTENESVLERVARAKNPGAEASRSLDAAEAALPPAVCYHAYSALANSVIETRIITAEETCWRHEGAGLRPLERAWAFRMREIVFLGKARDAEEFRHRGMRSAVEFAALVGIDATVEVASDPFFAPTSRGRALLQRVKALKHELVVSCDKAKALAIASFNNHETFFGDAFNIRDGEGSAVTSACVAFGVERWTLAILLAHGINSANWPELGARAAAGAASC